LSDLKEKLFVLWGELAERKENGVIDPAQPLINKPFECCIQEYGVPDGKDGWIRLHRIHHTTIK